MKSHKEYPLGAVKGFFIALPFSLALWAGIIWIILKIIR
jgi:hypothetical protein